MHFLSRYKAALAVIAAAFVFMLTGCAQDSGLFAYTEGAAQFTLVFTSVSGDTDEIRAACQRDETGNTTLTVTEPARLAGFTVTCTETVTSAVMGDTVIPLSPDAAQGLTVIFDALSTPGTPIKSADGTCTVIDTGAGTVTLDETMKPVAVDTGEVAVEVEGWQMGTQNAE